MISVAPIAPRDSAAWDDYVRASPRATFFHQLAWQRVLIATFGYEPHYLIARRAGATVGVLPLFAGPGRRGRRLVSLPHSVYGGAVADDADAEAALIDAARALARRRGARAVELRNRHAPYLALAPLPIAVTFEKPLPGRARDVIGTLPGNARNAARQAARKHGLVARVGRDPAAFHRLLAPSYHRLGTPLLPRRLFDHVLAEIGAEAWIVFVGNATAPPIAAVFVVEFRGTLMPLWYGEAAGARGMRPANLAYLRLMELGVDRGLVRFDFGRTLVGNAGGIAFKRHHGFTPEPLPYQLDILDGSAPRPLDPYRGWALALRQTWARLPAWLVDWVGPSIARRLP